MTVIAEQFGGPSGALGHVVTQLLARGNGEFNRWIVGHLAREVPAPDTVIELGSGPGIALQELAQAYPTARIVGVDTSDVVQKSARRRNAAAIRDGRLTLVHGDIGAATAYQPADLVLAVHVIYFWSDPVAELQRVHDALAPTGRLALGYQLRQNMPKPAQRNFPKAGYTLFDSDDQVTALLHRAGFADCHVNVFGSPEHPGGRLHIARARPYPAIHGTHSSA